MKVESFADPEAFHAEVGPFLAADPVRHTIAITVLGGLRSTPPATKPVLLAIRDNDSITGLFIWTPPWAVVATGVPPEAAPAVVDHLRDAGLRPTAANGAKPEATAFAQAWAAATGVTPVVAGESRLHRLTELTPPTGVPGDSAIATEADLAVLARWTAAFAAEAQNDNAERPVPDEAFTRRKFLTGDPALFWRVAGEPVAMAGVSAPLMDMSLIGNVYTPPEHRGHGYGSAATAAAVRWAQHAGARHVLLFTDLANPTSNAMYHRLGFRPVFDTTTIALPLA